LRVVVEDDGQGFAAGARERVAGVGAETEPNFGTALFLLALTVHEDQAYLQPLIQVGARGYLLRRSAAEDLVRAVRIIAEGGMYLDPAIADKAFMDASEETAPA
jgi:DNA-binding NarL/FixJ family response regulator